MMFSFFTIDFPALITAVMCGLSCALMGSFLVVRREALLADAISHSVLPGIVIAFFLVSDREGLGVFIGALLAAISSAIFIKILKLYGKMESGAATGVVFSLYFALGIVLLEKLSSSNIDLDVDCVLHGQIETIFWAIPNGVQLYTREALSYLPVEVIRSFQIFAIVAAFLAIFYKELILFSFDHSFAKVTGGRVILLDLFFVTMVALVVVSAFRVVGSILVIAMLVCPAACARLYVDKMSSQLLISCVFSVIGTILGYLLGAFLPLELGFSHSIGVAGVIAVVSGLLLTFSVIFAPKYGVLGKKLRIENQKRLILREDILGYLFRQIEVTKQNLRFTRVQLEESLYPSRGFERVISALLADGLLSSHGDLLELSDTGKDAAKLIIRKHRLWESYLVNQAGIKEDHVHQSAEELEHITTRLQEKVLESKLDTLIDPHGKPIPKG